MEDACNWVRVECNGVWYEVAPRYIEGVSLARASELARAAGCMLPFPALVDAIWSAADCKVHASTLTRSHDGTAATMSSPSVLADQTERVQRAIDAWSQAHGRLPNLVAGTHKDVIEVKGKIGLYGWQRSNGKPIQSAFFGHALGWRDYSQGLRLVRLC